MGAELVVITLGGLGMSLAAAAVNGVWQHWKKRPRDPRAILAERYARGDIDDDDYQRRLTLLTYGPPLLELGSVGLAEPEERRRAEDGA